MIFTCQGNVRTDAITKTGNSLLPTGSGILCFTFPRFNIDCQSDFLISRRNLWKKYLSYTNDLLMDLVLKRHSGFMQSLDIDLNIVYHAKQTYSSFYK